jgi:hypothetical protein
MWKNKFFSYKRLSPGTPYFLRLFNCRFGKFDASVFRRKINRQPMQEMEMGM